MAASHFSNSQDTDPQFPHLASPRVPVASAFLRSGHCFGSLDSNHHTLQVLQTCRHALRRADGRVPKFHILFHHRPSRIAVLCQRPEEARKVDVSLPDDGEDLVLDSFFECPLETPGLLQHSCVAVLDVYQTQFVLVLLGFQQRVPQTVKAMPRIETQSYIRVRGSIEESLALSCRFNIARDLRLKHQIQT